MKQVTILRDPDRDDRGTFGKLVAQGGFECYTGELPWRDLNQDSKRDPNVSCIAAGVYIVRWAQSNSRKNPDGSREWSFLLTDVPDAEGVRIHPGNFIGDKAKGFAADAEGCILLGRAVMDLEIPASKRLAQPWISTERLFQKGISSSRDAVAAFVAHMGKDPFALEITEVK